MSIDIDAALIYGEHYPKLVEHIDEDELNELLDYGTLDYASPFYDAPRSYWVVGIALPTEISDGEALAKELERARKEFKEHFQDVTGRVICSPHVT